MSDVKGPWDDTHDDTQYCGECGENVGTQTRSWTSDTTGRSGQRVVCAECGSTVALERIDRR